MVEYLKYALGFHPRAFLHALLTYPRFLGRIKPELLRGQEQEARALLRSFHARWQCARLKAPIGRRLVVITPHPDDEVIGAGGLLLAHRGISDVHIVNLFDGAGGGRLEHVPYSEDPAYRAELVAERRRELLDVSQALGSKTVRQLNLGIGIGEPTASHVATLRQVIEEIDPDVVLLPWYLDNHRDHRLANIIYAWASGQRECMVLGYEIWTLCEPNAIFDITDWISEKVRLAKLYKTQTATVDYSSYIGGLAATRAFHAGVRGDRGGAAEAFLALPSRDYCELVVDLYGRPGQLTGALR